MKKALFILFVLFACKLNAADYYWIGGGGNWSDLNHWRLVSPAGAIPSIVPSTGDNVFFGSYSGFGTTTATKTVTLDANGFCNNMTWEAGVPNNPRFVTANVAFSIEVWGNLNLSPTTTYILVHRMRGGTVNTITSNGPVLGEFGLDIDKPGGGITITDSLVVPSGLNNGTNGITFTSGNFDIAGKKLAALTFVSTGTATRVLNMTNSDFTAYYRFYYTGTNKTLNAGGSILGAYGYFFVDGGIYNIASSNAVDRGNFGISGTTFSKLTFNTPSAVSRAWIGDLNTIDTLVFRGSGEITSSNTIHYASMGGSGILGHNNIIDTVNVFGGGGIGSNNRIDRITFGGGSSMGAGNVIPYFETGGAFTVTAAGVNTVDSLLLAPNHTVTFRGTFNINKYLLLDGQPCDAFTEVYGDSTSGSLNFANGAVVDINNMILTGVKAYGAVTPIAVSAIDGGGNAGFAITPPTSGGTTLYWVGGPGDWNDRTHWSNTSGGSGGACVPFIGDDVVFDGNSGLASGTVTTSSTSFCKNMTWVNVGNVTFAESGSFGFQLYGSLVMDNSVTMNAVPLMVGSVNASITTNGSTLGNLQFDIGKTNGGTVTLTDDWTNPTGGSFVLRLGGLDLSGRAVNIVLYTSSINSARSLNISNATITVRDYWDFRGTGKTLNATGSHIITNGGFGSDGQNYPWVDATNPVGIGIGFPISATTFGQLTFISNSSTSNALVGATNTIRRLEFKGRGAVGTGNAIDSLILAGSRNYTITGIQTINKYIQAEATPCSGLTEIRGVGTFAFANGAELHISNIYLQNMTATGSMIPVTFNGADAGGNNGWIINSTPGTRHYWVGGAGDWNDNAHWSATSGGSGGACIPTVFDDVYFDANSGFTAVSKTVTINNGNAYCHNINWSGAANNPIWNKGAWTIESWGDSVILNPNATFTVAPLTLKGNSATFLKGDAPVGNFDIAVDKPGGSLTLLNNYNNPQTDIALYGGALNAASRTLNISSIDNIVQTNATSVDISNSILTLVYWRYINAATARSLNAVNSAITTPQFYATSFVYNKVTATGAAANVTQPNSTTIDSLIFTDPNSVSAVGIFGSTNTLNYVEYKGGGGIYGSGNIIDTLVFFPGKTYVFAGSSNNTITGEWYGSGTPCRLTEIRSTTTANAIVNKTSGDITFDYVRLQRITGTGGATFGTREHSIDQGGNTGWNMMPYDGAAPIYGLGPDVMAAPDDFPYVLRTDGFFGSPSSQYTWNDGSTADTLLVTQTGAYNVAVSFPDGCTIKDTITIAPASTLPVTLVSFTARSKDCQSLLNWKVTDVENFSHFEIEQSKDNLRFNTVGQVLYTQGRYEYSYTHTDGVAVSGTSYYHLKCVDIDGRYKYSPIVSVRSACDNKLIRVYPTITRDMVQVVLPQGYEKAQLFIINTSGQRMGGFTQTTGLSRVIGLQTLPASTYLLQVVNDRETKSFKIIKQ